MKTFTMAGNKVLTLSKLQMLIQDCPREVISEIKKRLQIKDGILLSDLDVRLLFFYAIEIMHYFGVVDILDECNADLLKVFKDGGYNGRDYKSKIIKNGYPNMARILDKELFEYLLDPFILEDRDISSDYSRAYDKFTSEIGWGIYCKNFYDKIRVNTVWKKLLRENLSKYKNGTEYFDSLPFPIIKPFISNGSIIEYLAFNPDIKRGWRNRYKEIDRFDGIDTNNNMSIFYDEISPATQELTKRRVDFAAENHDNINGEMEEKIEIRRKTCDESQFENIKARLLKLKRDLDHKRQEHLNVSQIEFIDQSLAYGGVPIHDRMQFSPALRQSYLHSPGYQSISSLETEEDKDVEYYKREYYAVFQNIASLQFRSWDSAYLQYEGGEKLKAALLQQIIEAEDSNEDESEHEIETIKNTDMLSNIGKLVQRIESHIKSPLKALVETYDNFGRTHGDLSSDPEWWSETEDTVASILGNIFQHIRRTTADTKVWNNFRTKQLTRGESEYLKKTLLFKIEKDSGRITLGLDTSAIETIVIDLNKLIDRILYAPEFIALEDMEKGIEIMINALRNAGCLASLFLRYSIINVLKLREENIKREFSEVMTRGEERSLKDKKTDQILKIIGAVLNILKKSWKILEVREKNDTNTVRASGGKYTVYPSVSKRKILYMDIDDNDLSYLGELNDLKIVHVDIERICTMPILNTIKHNLSLRESLGPKRGFSYERNGIEITADPDDLMREAQLDQLREGREISESDHTEDDIRTEIFEKYIQLNQSSEITSGILTKQLEVEESRRFLFLVNDLLSRSSEEWSLYKFDAGNDGDKSTPSYTILFGHRTRKTAARSYLPLSILLWFIPIQKEGLKKLYEYYYKNEINSIGDDGNTVIDIRSKRDFACLKNLLCRADSDIEYPFYLYDIERLNWNRDNTVKDVGVNIHLTGEETTQCSLGDLMNSVDGAEKLCEKLYKEKTMTLSTRQYSNIYKEILCYKFGRQAIWLLIYANTNVDKKKKIINEYNQCIELLKMEGKIHSSVKSLGYSVLCFEENDDDESMDSDTDISSEKSEEEKVQQIIVRLEIKNTNQNIMDQYKASNPGQPEYIYALVAEQIDSLCKKNDRFMNVFKKIWKRREDPTQWRLRGMSCSLKEWGMAPVYDIEFTDQDLKLGDKLSLNALLWFIPIQETAIQKLREYYQDSAHNLSRDYGKIQNRDVHVRNFEWLKKIVSDYSKQLHFPCLYMELKSVNMAREEVKIGVSVSRSEFTISVDDFLKQDTAMIAIDASKILSTEKERLTALYNKTYSDGVGGRRSLPNPDDDDMQRPTKRSSV